VAGSSVFDAKEGLAAAIEELLAKARLGLHA
jgi:hypothetical protein